MKVRKKGHAWQVKHYTPVELNTALNDFMYTSSYDGGMLEETRDRIQGTQALLIRLIELLADDANVLGQEMILKLLDNQYEVVEDE